MTVSAKWRWLLFESFSHTGPVTVIPNGRIILRDPDIMAAVSGTVLPCDRTLAGRKPRRRFGLM